jgi:invasion protein IalB
MRRLSLIAAFFLTMGVAGASSTAGVAAELLGAHGDWKTYTHGTGDGRMCFAVSEPSESNPGAGRQKPYVYVTAWPKAGIKAEISVLVGVALKKGSEIEVDVDGNRFGLSPDGDRAYVDNASQETRLLDAMRRGRTMTVIVTPEGGKALRDMYSLTGITAAIQELAASCS